MVRATGWGVAVFCAASRRLRARDQWIGWSEEQRRRRLPLVVNNCRFLLLPHKTFPNLGSRALRLSLDRLSADWQGRYGHPVVLVETFVDPEQFSGTVYTANGWEELGTTDGFGRVRRDFYVQHKKPKRLFARELCGRARRSLAADQLKPALAVVEARTRPRSPHSPAQIRALVDQKTNEIPVARELFHRLDLDGRKVSLDALHTQDQTARELVLEHGADYLLTVKDNQPLLRATIEKLVPAPPAVFPPRAATATLAGRREFNKGQPEARVLRSRASSAEAMDFPCVEQVALLRRHLRQHSPRDRRPGDQPAAGRVERRPVAGIQPRRLGHRKRPAPAPGASPPRRPVPRAPAAIHAGHRHVPPLQQQPLHALAQPPEETQT